MKALLFASAVSILLSGCAANYAWYKPGGSDLTLQRESAFCELQKRQYTDQIQAQDRLNRTIEDSYGPSVGGFGVGFLRGLGSDPLGLEARDRYLLCMKSLGWTQVQITR